MRHGVTNPPFGVAQVRKSSSQSIDPLAAVFLIDQQVAEEHCHFSSIQGME